MEDTRAFFSQRYGVEASDFTVIVGESYQAMAPVFQRIAGWDLSIAYSPYSTFTRGWVIGAKGSADKTMGLVLGSSDRDPLGSVRHIIAHEYFHILQGKLFGFAEHYDNEDAWKRGDDATPTWLIEGMASYAEYLYSPYRMDGRPYLSNAVRYNAGRYTPYLDVAWQQQLDTLALADAAQELQRISQYDAFHQCDEEWNSYSLSFIATRYLVEIAAAREASYVDFWRLLGERLSWQQAFEEAFGLTVAEFYASFNEWMAASSPVPSMVRFKLQLQWPGQPEAGDAGATMFKVEEDFGTWENVTQAHVVYHSTGSGRFYVVYPAGATGSGILSLHWWSRSDPCTRYRLGYYKDGGLTTERDEATRLDFTGASQYSDWTIPAPPSQLPRIGCNGCNCAGFRQDE